MMKTIQSPNSLHLKLGSSITNCIKISFDNSQGYVNAKDFQIQCLIEYENLRNKGLKVKKKIPSMFRGSLLPKGKHDAEIMEQSESSTDDE